MIDGILVTKTNDRRSIQISTSQHNLNVCDADSKQIIYALNVHNLKLDLGGNNQNLVFVNSPDLNGEVVYFEADRQNINKLRENPNLVEKIKLISKEKNKSVKLSIYGLLGISLLLTVLFYFRSPIAGQMSQLIPFKLEEILAEKIFTTGNDNHRSIIHIRHGLALLFTFFD